MDQTALKGFAERLLAPAPEETEADATPETEASIDEPEVEETQDAVEASEDAPEADAEETAEDEGADDVDDAEDDAEADEQPQKFTVKVDGVEQEVTLDELTRGYSGQKYVQQRMEEAATRRKEAEQLYHQIEAQRQEFLQMAQQVQTQGVLEQPTPPDPSLIQSDPFRYMEQQASYQQGLQQYEQQRQMIETQRQQHEQARQRAHAEHLAQQKQRMAELVPEMADPTAAPQFEAKLVRAAVDHYGLTEADLGAVTDARHVSILADAMRYRELQVTKPVEAPKPVRAVKPKAKTPKPASVQRRQMRDKARKTQSVDDFAAMLLDPQLKG